MNLLFGILLNNIVPIFILIFLGFVLGRKFEMDMNTLTKLNFYLYVPAFAFVNIFTTEISVELLFVIGVGLLFILINFFLGAGMARILKLPLKTTKAFENSLMFNNSGNIGISLVTLVYSNAPFLVDGEPRLLQGALSVQIMVLLVQNLTTNTIGFINSGGEGMNAKVGLQRVLKMPVIYSVACAFLFKLLPFDFTATPLWPALDYLRGGMVSIALVILGIQLSRAKINLKSKTPYIASFFRLIGGPAIAFVLIKIFGFEGVTAQAILISASTPTAVNTALLSSECKGDTDFAVQTVTISTLFSAITMTTVIYLANILF